MLVIRKLVFFAAIGLTAFAFVSAVFSANIEPRPQLSEYQSAYIGSETCARCHANTFATFNQTWHAIILRPADASNILGDFSSSGPDLTFKLEDVEWVLGGQYKQRYLTNIDGRLFVLPAEWNIVTGEWGAYHAEGWRLRPYSQYCAGCHTTGYDATTQTWVEPGVGCEACHGPGRDHVTSTGNRAMIINPAGLSFQDQIEVCAQCHSRGEDPSGQFPFPVGYHPGGPAKLSETFVFSTDSTDYWPDGTAKRHHMQYHDWRLGAHRDSVGCIFCHTSHTIGETDHQTRMVGNDRCIVCHEGNTDLVSHIPFMASTVDKVNCTDCHMPQISMLVPTDFQIRSHSFRPPNPALSITYDGQDQMPNACNLCHLGQTPEWAASILGQEIPSVGATPVPPPTPLPISTAIVRTAIESRTSEQLVSLEPEISNRSSWLWLVGFAAMAGFLGTLWTIRKAKRI